MGSLTGLTVVSKTANYTATLTDAMILVDATGGAVTITMPAATTPGQFYLIKKTDISINAVTISRAGADLLDGSTTVALATQFSARILISDGTSRWYVFGVI